MAVSFQLVIDCADPEPLARFWAAALGYELEPPPAGFASWDAYWRDVGVPEDELGLGADCIADPDGRGPRICFQVVPERKAAKNRLHLDISVSGGRAVPISVRALPSPPPRARRPSSSTSTWMASRSISARAACPVLTW
jgi:hypothetical protein